MMTGSGVPDELSELVLAWRHHVDKIDRERSLSGDDPEVAGDVSVWGAHDLPAALYIRDRLESGLAELPSDEAAAQRRLVAQVDRRFRDSTVDDDAHLLDRLLGEDLTGRRWWWRRIPPTGPIRDELRRWFE